jgi:glycosyltransferase involved in cell wall biosynthesis
MRKRVLHVIRSLEAGGAERIVVEYALNHDSAAYAAEVCCLERAGHLAEPLEARGIPVHVLARTGRLDVRALFRLARLMRRGRFDVVHYHNFGPLVFALPAAVLAAVPSIVRTEHNVVHWRSRRRRVASRMAALRENAQIAVSEAVKQSHINESDLPAARCVTVWNGIDPARLSAGGDRRATRSALGIPENAPVAVAVGSLTPQKNYENLLEAAAHVLERVPEVIFLVIGTGVLRRKLEAKAGELGVAGSVRFLGERDDVPAILAASDILVNSSSWEGLPVSILEAMAAGIPTAATDVGGNAELLETGGPSGIVVPAEDPQALGDAILRLAGSRELRADLGSRARVAAMERFSAACMTRETERIYDLCAVDGVHLAASGRIRVLFLIGELGRGGAERQLLELVSRLDRERYEPIVCCLAPPTGLSDAIREVGVEVISLNKRPGIGPVALCRLCWIMRRLRPAVVHSYLFSANWRGLLGGRLLRVPVIISSVRNVDFHPTFGLTMLDRLMGVFVDRVIANADAVKRFVVERHWIDRDRVHVVYNGIGLERIDAAIRTHDSDPGGESARRRRPTVIKVASLTPKKDHSTFLEAARLVLKTVPDARFLIVGGGKLHGVLDRRIRELGLQDSIVLVGETSNVAGHLVEADVSVLTSLREGCSNALLESMALGTPIVATDVGGNSELVRDGVEGFLVPTGDASGVAERVVQLLLDADLRARMGRAGRARIDSRFTAARMVDDTVALYEELLETRVPGLVEWSRIRKARAGRSGGGACPGGRPVARGGDGA